MEDLAAALEGEGFADQAWELELEALEIARGLRRGRRLFLVALGNLGYTCISRSQYEDAIRYLQQGLSLALDLGETAEVAGARCNMALALIHLGRVDEAGRFAAEATIAAIESASQILGISCLEVLAAVESKRGNHRFAARLLGSAEALRQQFEYELEPAEGALHDRTVETMRGVLAASDLTSSWTEGAAMDLEEAFALIGREFLE
jgi:tetratricopeptide (TPR) repeat protein